MSQVCILVKRFGAWKLQISRQVQLFQRCSKRCLKVFPLDSSPSPLLSSPRLSSPMFFSFPFCFFAFRSLRTPLSATFCLRSWFALANNVPAAPAPGAWNWSDIKCHCNALGMYVCCRRLERLPLWCVRIFLPA